MSPMGPDAIAAMPVTPMSQSLRNHQYDVLPGALHSWVPQMHASVLTCSPKTDPVVKLVLRYILGLRKGKIHATKEIQTRRNNS